MVAAIGLKPLLGVIESLFDPLGLLECLFRLGILLQKDLTGGNILDQILDLLLLISDASLQLLDVDLSLISDLRGGVIDEDIIALQVRIQ